MVSQFGVAAPESALRVRHKRPLRWLGPSFGPCCVAVFVTKVEAGNSRVGAVFTVQAPGASEALLFCASRCWSFGGAELWVFSSGRVNWCPDPIVGTWTCALGGTLTFTGSCMASPLRGRNFCLRRSAHELKSMRTSWHAVFSFQHCGRNVGTE